ncbi:rRNA methylase [Methylocystis sp. 9N]|uniref:rRNA methylase n=1 Tax=Methylocystis borbori TaxID=3118750 RepID=A0ABU7XDD7_9HYPH
MSHQAIRFSFVIWERLLKSLNAAIFTALLLLGLYAVATNFAEMSAGVRRLFDKITQVQSFEAFNVKAAFKVDQIVESTAIYASLPAEMKELLPADILSLRPSWVERILYVGDQGKLCDYSFPDKKMIENRNSDLHLAADGLIRIEDAPKIRAEVLKEMRDAKAKGEEWTIGEPKSCYATQLTERGRNVKTALVQFLREGFSVAATGKSEARGAEKMKMAGVAPR